MKPKLDATIENVTEEQRGKLLMWLHELESTGPRCGLWIYGDRVSGTSYIARVAMRRLAYVEKLRWEWATAKNLIEAKRDFWSADEQVRRHPDDYALWQERAGAEADLDAFWSAEAACVDDLHETLDIRFWMKHLHFDLEARVKESLPTIVATTMAPNHRELESVTRVLDHYFVTCHATR